MSNKYIYSVQLHDYEVLGGTLADVRETLTCPIGVCDQCGSATEDELIGHTMIKVRKPFRKRPYWSTQQETNDEWEARGTHSGYALRCDNPECATITPILREQRY